jgi:CBS-domain-containing membrane protein
LLFPFNKTAFICLQFGLTAAPAAQPRTCLVGQALSISIALTVSLLPFLPTWLKQSLGTSLAIAVMTRCGVTHPPAGASAFLFASGLYGITHFVLLLAANFIAIFFGIVTNNLSEKRQYPTYYAIGLNPKDMVAYLTQ